MCAEGRRGRGGGGVYRSHLASILHVHAHTRTRTHAYTHTHTRAHNTQEHDSDWREYIGSIDTTRAPAPPTNPFCSCVCLFVLCGRTHVPGAGVQQHHGALGHALRHARRSPEIRQKERTPRSRRNPRPAPRSSCRPLWRGGDARRGEGRRGGALWCGYKGGRARLQILAHGVKLERGAAAVNIAVLLAAGRRMSASACHDNDASGVCKTSMPQTRAKGNPLERRKRKD